MCQTRLILMIKTFIVLLMVSVATGCATTPDNIDPLEPANRASYSFNEALDRALLKPVAETYAEYTPELAQAGITNFFDNLTYLNVVLNSFLQGKIDQGLSDATRFLFNSTIGLLGLVDVGTAVGLPAHNEDFGQTLATWGFDEGSYLYIPVGGPNTTRNLPNYATSFFLNPLSYATGAILFPLTAVGVINKRANLLESTRIRDEAAVDPYAFTREAYLQKRRFLIYDGNPPVEGYDDIFDLENGGAGEGGESGTLIIE